MKINFRRFMAMMLAVLMVFGAFSTLATAADTATADACIDGGEHDWIQLGDDATAIVPPTCEEDGYTWYYCVKCNAKDIQNIKPALGHDFQPSTVKPNCKVDGKYVETCSREGCGATQKESVLTPDTNIVVDFDGTESVEPAYWEGEHYVAGHRFEWTLDPSTPDAKCGEVAVYWLTCVNHGTNPTDICGWVAKGPVYRVTPHNYVEHHVEKEPSCFEYGIMRFECSGCDGYKDVKIEKLEHTWEAGEDKTATCTETGYTDYKKCTVCGEESFTLVPVDENNHTGLSGDATCTVPQTCSACNKEVVGALNHPETETVTTPATCTKDGSVVVTCKLCGEVLSSTVLPMLNHEGTQTTTQTQKPTCIADGWETVTCECGEVISDIVLKAPGHHTYGADVVYGKFIGIENDPTDNYCTASYTCTACGERIENEKCFDNEGHRAPLGHKVEADPTCTEYGSYYYFCEHCGYASEPIVMDPLEHKDPATGELNAVLVPGYAPTCAAPGMTDGYVCGYCQETLVGQDVIPNDDIACGAEDYSITFTGQAPTCTQPAGLVVICNVCKVEVPYDVWKDWPGLASCRPLGHDYQPVTGTPATCTATGLTDGSQCTRCLEWETEQEIIDMLPHSYTVEVKILPNTCLDDGYTIYQCEGCDATENRDFVPADENAHPTEGYLVTTEPDCINGGQASFYCKRCGAKDDIIYYIPGVTEELHPNVVDLIKPTGHTTTDENPEDGSVIYYIYIAPTCAAEGYEAHYCTVCGMLADERTIPVDPTAHPADMAQPNTYTDWTPDTAGILWGGKTYLRTPSCYGDGMLWLNCDACHKDYSAYDVGTQLQHDYDAGEEIEPAVLPQCGVPGKTAVIKYTCTCEYYALEWNDDHTDRVEVTYNCDNSYEIGGDEVPALEHDISWQVLTSADCENDAVLHVICANCGKMDKDVWKDLIPEEYWVALGHDHSGPDADCENDKVCARDTCDKVLEEKLGHDLPDDWTIVNDATCTTTGLKIKECGRDGCDYYEDEEIAALDHTYDEEETAPTCTEDGYITITCARCDYKDVQPGKPATDHAMGDWIIDTPATCTENGLKYRECGNDGCTYVETEVIPFQGHKPAEMLLGFMCGDDEDCPNGHNFKAPTCEEPGVGYGRICTVCKSCVNEEGVDHPEIPALGGECRLVTFDIPVGCENYGFTYTICVQCGDGYGLETELRPNGKIWNDDMPIEGIITNYKPATGHDMKTDGKVDPWCTTDGYYYEYCANGCGLENVIGDTIPALGHDAANHKDADGNYLDEEINCARCGVALPGHRDAEGNNMFEYRTDMEVKLGANNECIKTCYLIAYCPDEGCEYKKVEKIWLMTDEEGNPDFDHDMVPDEAYNEEHAGDDLNGGSYKEVCENGCGYETIDHYEAELDDMIIFDDDIYGSDENGNKRGEGMIVNGGYMTVKINISGANLNIWGIQLDLTYDSEKLVFEQALTEAANTDNGFSNQFNANSSMGKLKIVSTYDELDESGNRMDLPFSALNADYITLIFAVKSTAYSDTANILAEDFAYTNIEVEDIYGNSPADIAFNPFGEVRIWKAADLSGDGALSLSDTNNLMDFVVNFADGAYDARADINWDGEINGADFRAIKKILMNEGLYDGVYEDILDGYIVA